MNKNYAKIIKMIVKFNNSIKIGYLLIRKDSVGYFVPISCLYTIINRTRNIKIHTFFFTDFMDKGYFSFGEINTGNLLTKIISNKEK